MERFLVIEEYSSLPQWLVKRVGAYLPSAVRAESLCGADGEHRLYHELSSKRAWQSAVRRLRDAQEMGVVCGAVCREEVRRTIEEAVDAPLADGRIVSAALRLAQTADEAGGSLPITLVGADSPLGQAAAAYLAKRVRYLAVDGRRTTVLHRLAQRLWQTEGIAVRVGCSEGDRLISMDEISRPFACMTAGGRHISSVMAECALMAGANMLGKDRIITARTLAQTVEAARFCGIALLPKKGAQAGKFD